MSDTSPSRRTVVGAIIVDSLERPTRIVAAQRSEPGELVGYWEFPGGKLEPGETAEQALHRELEEELSITVEIGTELSNDGGAWPISERLDLRLFFVELINGELRPGPVHNALRWLPAEELHDVVWLPADSDAVAALAVRLTDGSPVM